MTKKVMWISSFLPRSCGIAYYSDDYIDALKKYSNRYNHNLSIRIIAHTDAKKADFPIIDLKDANWNEKVFAIIKKEKPQIVHIQHEYGLYETYGDCNKHLLELIKMIHDYGIPVVMTFHTIFKKLEPAHAEFVSAALKLLDAAFFHEEYQKKAISKNIGWKPNNIYVLPHGSAENFNPDKEELRKDFGYEGKLVVGVAGLADQRKGFRTLIRQWKYVVKKFPNAMLSLEIKPHAAKETRAYVNKVMTEIMKSSVSKNIEIMVKEYGELEFLNKLASFDILALPYKSESQSGVLAHGFAAHTPAIVTDIEGLGAEIRNSKAGLAVKMKDRKHHFYKTIIKLLKSKRLRDKFSANAKKYVDKVSGWNIIARKTFKIYEKIQKEH